MPISKQLVAGNAVNVAYHRIVRANVDADMSKITFQVGSWINEDHFKTGASPLWHEYVERPMTADVSQSFYDMVVQEGKFTGAVTLPDVAGTLDEAKVRRWAEIKVARNDAQWSGFEVEGIGRFDSDEASQAKIMGAAAAAIIAQVRGLQQQIEALATNVGLALPPCEPAAPVDWTLEDNSVTSLDADEVINVGLTLLQHVSTQFARARALREAIESAQSLSDIAAVQWPT